MKTGKLRAGIDQLDARIVSLLNRRARLAARIGQLKEKLRRFPYDPEREEAIITSLVRLNPGPLDREDLMAIYREVISACRKLEKKPRIAFLGPEASFSHAAAKKRFGQGVDFSPQASIADVFLEVEKNNCDFGVVPIENSLEGAVTNTMDMITESDLNICAEIFLPVSHCLLARRVRDRIERIYSHPQVFGQCRGWLQKKSPGVELIEVASTAQAARLAASEKGAAALASRLAAAVYGLKVLAERIEDNSGNITRFMVIGRLKPAPSGRDRTSILFSLPHRAGSLYDALSAFKRRGINLTRIESRPFRKKPWEYYFFVDFEGHRCDKKIKAALLELQEACLFLKILGSYPRND